jgi:UDP-glucose 4-epimerase
MKVLVTGGAGFIGSHLVERLLEEGHKVTVLDNEATGRRENVPPAVRYLKGDVAQSEDLKPAFAEGPDAVFHVAGQVSLIRSFSDPATDLRTNVQGTLGVIQACLKHRVPRLLFASSMQVYGDTDVVPTPEEVPCRPASYYGITKYAAERFVHTTAERSDLDFALRVTSFRMYNVYGPRQALDNPYQGVLGIFLGNLLRGEPLTVFGDGEQSRDFVYVSDVADAWVKALENPASYGCVFNLGSGQETSINRLADLALAALGRSRRDHAVRHAPGRPGELRRVAADVARARDVLGWKPQTSFADGLAQTVGWAVQQTEARGLSSWAGPGAAPNAPGGAPAGSAS